MPKVDLVLVVPAYNEIEVLETNIAQLRSEIASLDLETLIVIAEDGSTDGTSEAADKLSKTVPGVAHLHKKKRHGKGAMITQAMLEFPARMYIMIDSDLSSDLKHIRELTQGLSAGANLIIGSRYLKGSYSSRHIRRFIASFCYNLGVRLLFRTGVHDHQCGLKGLSSEVVACVLPHMISKGFFWDAELIIRAMKLGFEVKEWPVIWTEDRGNGSSKVNVFKTSLKMGAEMLRFKGLTMRKGLTGRPPAQPS